MKKKYKDFFIMLGIFMVFLFRNSINEIIIILSKDFNFTNATAFVCEEEIKENQELKNIIDMEKDNYEFITSRVKYRNVLNFKDEFQIFKGSKAGLEEGFAVINEKGLIGTIKTVDKNISMVELITNKNSNISVRIGDVYGVLKYHDNELLVSDITNYGNVSIGEDIVTSGIGNLPGEILIGTVKDITLSSIGIEQIITVDPAVDFHNITYLLVVKS